MRPSLLDNDLYKFTMAQAVLHHFPSAEVVYKLIVRSKVDLSHMVSRVQRKIDMLCGCKMEDFELAYLRSIRFLKPDFVDFLEDFTLKSRFVTVGCESGQLAITVKGPWISTIMFEVPVLAAISEAYGEEWPGKEDLIHAGRERNIEKIRFLTSAAAEGFKFADFGTRRRFSRSWHAETVSNFVRLCKGSFIGSSNVELAMRTGVKPIGTMAHEWLQAGQGLGQVQLVNSQKFMLDTWSKEYRGDLGIALTDTISMDAFLRDFDPFFAKLYDGCRHDSGDPVVWGEKLIAHYEKLGIDPMTKSAVFSDNLNFEKARELLRIFGKRIKTSFGIGTWITNDVGVKPLSIVMKLHYVNGNPVAKISDEPGKVVCEDVRFLDYLKSVYKVG